MFFAYFCMGRPKGAGKGVLLKEIRKRKRRSLTIYKLYDKLSEETGASKGSIRVVASRAGLTSPAHSLMYSFSEEEEDALVNVCVAYARKGEPFTILDFITIASIFDERFEKSDFFSCSFAKRFRKRHSDVLSIRKGKITSPTR